jgi:hypothetical protein
MFQRLHAEIPPHLREAVLGGTDPPPPSPGRLPAILTSTRERLPLALRRPIESRQGCAPRAPENRAQQPTKVRELKIQGKPPPSREAQALKAVDEFVAQYERCEPKYGSRASTLHEQYLDYCERARITRPLRGMAFYHALEQRGVARRRYGWGAAYGLRLPARGDPVPVRLQPRRQTIIHLKVGSALSEEGPTLTILPPQK